MAILGRRLAKAGFATACLHYPSMRSDLPAIAALLEPQVRQFAAANPGDVHFVTHSLGGLALRALLARYRPANMGRVVMLAPPHQGSEWADVLSRWRIANAILGPNARYLVTQGRGGGADCYGPVDYPLGIVAGNRPIDVLIAPRLITGAHDGKVSVAATRLEGMTAHVVVPVGHPLMPFHPLVARQALSFLRDGHFLEGD